MEIGLAIYVAMMSIFGTLITQQETYNINKADSCTEHYEETTKSYREYCYLKKDADELGYKVSPQ